MTVEVLWDKDTQELGCGQISIVVTYNDRERHEIIYLETILGK